MYKRKSEKKIRKRKLKYGGGKKGLMKRLMDNRGKMGKISSGYVNVKK
jgi:hypothetical protein